MIRYPRQTPVIKIRTTIISKAKHFFFNKVISTVIANFFYAEWYKNSEWRLVTPMHYVCVAGPFFLALRSPENDCQSFAETFIGIYSIKTRIPLKSSYKYIFPTIITNFWTCDWFNKLCNGFEIGFEVFSRTYNDIPCIWSRHYCWENCGTLLSDNIR